MSKLRLGFVGCGYMGQLAHLENYARLPNVELVALAEGRPKLAELVARRFGIGKVYPDHRALCADPEIEAVVAIMNYTLHYGIVPDLLRAGKHVAIEKPMCLTRAAAQELVELAESRGLVLQVSYMKRCDPGVRLAVQRVREMRASKDFGELLHARVWCCHGDWQWQSPGPLKTDEPVPDYHTPREPKPAGLSDEDLAWLSAWLNYYSHQTNLLRHFLGEDYSIEHFHESERGAQALVTTPSGVTGALEFPIYRVSQWDEGIQLCFSQAVVRVDVPAPLARQRAATVTIYENRDNPRTIRPDVPQVWGMAEQARAFVAAVLDGQATLSPGREAAKEIEFAHSILEWRRATHNGRRTTELS